VVLGLGLLAWMIVGGGSGTGAGPGAGVTNNFPADTQYGSTPSNTTSPTQTAALNTSFLNDPETVKDPQNSGYYYLGYHATREGFPDPAATDHPPYLISYIASTQYFNVTILQEPLKAVREQAEAYLKQKTGLSNDEMCGLHYGVYVINDANSAYAGRNLGFSFCQGAVQFP